MTANGYDVSLWGDEAVFKFLVMVAGWVNILKTTESYTLKWLLLWYVDYISSSKNLVYRS